MSDRDRDLDFDRDLDRDLDLDFDFDRDPGRASDFASDRIHRLELAREPSASFAYQPSARHSMARHVSGHRRPPPSPL